MELRQWLERHGAWLLGYGLDTYRPGHIFRRRRVLFGASRFEHFDSVWMLTGRPEEDYPVIDTEAPLVAGTWTRRFDTDVENTLERFGLMLGAHAQVIRRVTLSARRLRARTLDDGAFSPVSLATSIKTHVQDPRDLYLAHTLFVVDAFTVSFEMTAGSAARAALPRLDVVADGTVTWASASDVQYRGPGVPFAFAGLRLG